MKTVAQVAATLRGRIREEAARPRITLFPDLPPPRLARACGLRIDSSDEEIAAVAAMLRESGVRGSARGLAVLRAHDPRFGTRRAAAAAARAARQAAKASARAERDAVAAALRTERAAARAARREARHAEAARIAAERADWNRRGYARRHNMQRLAGLSDDATEFNRLKAEMGVEPHRDRAGRFAPGLMRFPDGLNPDAPLHLVRRNNLHVSAARPPPPSDVPPIIVLGD